MNKKEYLSQALCLDQRINSKLEQVASLNSLAAKCTSTLTGMPRNPGYETSMMADTIDKVVDLKSEINHDIDNLVDIKRDIARAIKAVNNTEYQTLLELRYLCFKSWEQVAIDMGYNVRHIYRLHDKAVNSIEIPQTSQ